MSESASFETKRENVAFAEFKENMRDPSHLPAHREITRAFRTKAEWESFCDMDGNRVYEFINEEFVEALCTYLAQRISAYRKGEQPVTILEVGAGNGRLSHFLRERLEAKVPGAFDLKTTGSGTWRLNTTFPVETMDHAQALATYKPEIVIFSWMPYGEDATADFRAAESVKEYLLIGEEEGCCGDMWFTWGDKFGAQPEEKNKPAPYEADGFDRQEIKRVSDEQICRTDDPGMYYRSKTVSFRRKTVLN